MAKRKRKKTRRVSAAPRKAPRRKFRVGDMVRTRPNAPTKNNYTGTGVLCGDKVRLREGCGPKRFVGDIGLIVLIGDEVVGVQWSSYEYPIANDYHSTAADSLIRIYVDSMPQDEGYYEAITSG